MSEIKRLQQAERDAALDDILSRWHSYQRGDRLTDGYAGRAALIGEYKSPPAFKSLEDADEAADEQNNRVTMRQVDFEVSEIPDPWRSALHALARSLYTGHAVFHSPRILPQDRARVVAEAKERITVRLVAAGVID